MFEATLPLSVFASYRCVFQFFGFVLHLFFWMIWRSLTVCHFNENKTHAEMNLYTSLMRVPSTVQRIRNRVNMKCYMGASKEAIISEIEFITHDYSAA